MVKYANKHIGCAFTYIIPYFFSISEIVSYTHYPIISFNMIDKVVQRKADFNNNKLIANSKIFTILKYMYKMQG